MTPLFKKLNYKGQKFIRIFNKPESFDSELKGLEGLCEIHETSILKSYPYILAFCENKTQFLALYEECINLTEEPDGLLWFAYPKKSSKKYKSDLTRDEGWEIMGERGFEPVRQIAIDDDWSSLRFRKIENIKIFKRSEDFAMSAEGKKRAAGKNKGQD
ncbi:MAG: hypothetical protein IAE91_14475 [Ignavibacteriaceae bacterium]|nr:hypothetical protein [Ignavibacteriaceae bacterium]